jgi:pilus assembly protein Flp/PilA
VKKLIEKITYFLISKEKGATAVEYALIVALIAMAIIGAVTALGGGMNTAFTNIKNAITGAVGA